jgi:hypothetical protein
MVAAAVLLEGTSSHSDCCPTQSQFAESKSHLQLFGDLFTCSASLQLFDTKSLSRRLRYDNGNLDILYALYTVNPVYSPPPPLTYGL